MNAKEHGKEKRTMDMIALESPRSEQSAGQDVLHFYVPRVRDLMTKDPLTLSENDTLLTARDLFASKGIRHLPVTDEGGALTGLITHRDLLAASISKQTQFHVHVKVGEVMVRRISTTTPETPLSEAASLLYHQKYGCLPVVSAGRLVGILTEADFVHAFMNWGSRFGGR